MQRCSRPSKTLKSTSILKLSYLKMMTSANDFLMMLIRKSSQGVQVNLIYDSYGSKNTPVSFFQRLRDCGVSVLEFNPVNPGKVLVGKKMGITPSR